MPILLLLSGPPAEIDLPSIDGAIPVPGINVFNVDPSTVLTIELDSIDGASEPDGIFDVLLVTPAPTPPAPPTPTPGPSPPPPDEVYLSGSQVPPPFPGADSYGGADPLPPPAQVRARLVAPDGTPIGWLDNATQIEWQDHHNDDGAGAVTLPHDDPLVPQIVTNCEVQCYYYGTRVFTFVVVDGVETTPVDQGEEASQTVRVRGPGRAALLRRALVYSPKGVNDPFVPQHRIFSFASIDFPAANGFAHNAHEFGPQRTITNWGTFIELTEVIQGDDDVVEILFVPAPLDWPAPDAIWIWGQPDSTPIGTNYFRRTFTLGSRTRLGIYVTADNYYTLYIDGLPILGENAYDAGWKEHKRLELTLPAGTYTLGAIVENIPWPPEFVNPAGFLMAICPLNDDDEPVTNEDGDVSMIVSTDASWRHLAYPATEPGWTPGQIVRKLMQETQTRSGLVGWQLPAQNADTDGSAWPTMPDFSIPVGASVRDVLDSLVEQGMIDWNVAAGPKRLRLYNQSVAGPNSGVSHLVTGSVATQEIIGQTFSPQQEPVTRLLVKWSQGYFQIQDNAAISAWGVHEGFVTIDASTRGEAQRRAKVLLDDIKNPRWSSVVTIDPLAGNRPYSAYQVGDRITVPNRTGSPTAYRVVGISVSADDMGRPTVVLELDSRLLTRLRDENQLIQQLGTGVTGNTKVRGTLATTSGIAR